MTNEWRRRAFLQGTIVASSAAAAGLAFEEQALATQGRAEPPRARPRPKNTSPPFPAGKLGKLSVSRLICGGNLISGYAHSRDLIYVSPLLKRYFTDEKVFETLALCEEQGMNTAILRVDEDTIRIITRYWKERAGKIQWIAQAKMTEGDIGGEIDKAVDHGAVGVYIHGGVGDEMAQKGRVDLLGKALESIRRRGVVAGLAGHSIEVPKACEKAGLKPDFYMKTFNSKRYWSAGPQPRLDSVWEETPEETKAFMEELETPWIAYKVLGAGAIHPRQGFQYAFENGADFICVGMFDFQVAEDAALGRLALEKARGRNRPWCA